MLRSIQYLTIYNLNGMYSLFFLWCNLSLLRYSQVCCFRKWFIHHYRGLTLSKNDWRGFVLYFQFFFSSTNLLINMIFYNILKLKNKKLFHILKNLIAKFRLFSIFGFLEIENFFFALQLVGLMNLVYRKE